MKEDKTERVVFTRSPSCSFIFEWTGLTAEQEKRILEGWPTRKEHHLVNERIIQRYLEERDYAVEVIVYPFSMFSWAFPIMPAKKMEGKTLSHAARFHFELHREEYPRKEGPGKTVCFLSKRLQGSGDSIFRYYFNLLHSWLISTGPGVEGYSVIDVSSISQSISHALKDWTGVDEPTVTIRTASENLWPWANKNLKGMIHNWMQGIPYRDRKRIPVFKPEIHAPKTDSSGSRLSLSDLATVGILSGLLAHGVRSYDFDGPTEFTLASAVEMRDYLSMLLSEPVPGMGVEIEDPS